MFIFTQDGIESGFREGILRRGGLVLMLAAIFGVGHYFYHCLNVSSSRARAGSLCVSLVCIHAIMHSFSKCLLSTDFAPDPLVDATDTSQFIKYGLTLLA